MVKSWINMHRAPLEYGNKVESFLAFAFSNAKGSKLIVYPCNTYKVGHNYCIIKDEVGHHSMFNGFCPYCKECVHHRGTISRPSCSLYYNKVHSTANTQLEISFGDTDTMEILNDLFSMHDNGRSDMFHHEQNIDEEDMGDLGDKGNKGNIFMVNEDTVYERLLEQVEQELYQGSKF